MAYMSQEKKAKLAEGIKKAMPKGWKYSLSVRHHSTLVLTISAAPVDLIAENLALKERSERPEYHDLNEYYIEREYNEPLRSTFKEIKNAMMVGNHNNSDSQSDYVDVGWYIDIKIGGFERPFKYCPSRPAPNRRAVVSPAVKELTYEELKARVAELEKRRKL